MQYRQLGNTNEKVSVICLGTMTWGEQNTEAQAHEQLDYALDQGINFIDVAEMYPVPPKAETQGRTEEYLGTWLKKSGKRKEVLLATKVVGRSENFDYLRGEHATLSRQHIHHAVEGSLKRLQTDVIDLYQLHWPDRKSNFFGELGYQYDATDESVPLEESLSALKELVDAGKVRYIGLSNETPWGLMECLRLADKLGLPRVMSVQNPYNLVNRSYEVGLAEMSIREEVGLLAYSPLAFGVLTGKYRNGAMPAGSRLTIYTRFGRYNGDRTFAAAEEYCKIAEAHGLSPAQMALAYVNSRPFLTSNIIGATTMEQLKENIASVDITLTGDILEKIESVHRENSNPAP